MAEGTLYSSLMLVATRLGSRLLRNNVGMAWMGHAIELEDGSILIKNPRRVRFGVGNPGGSDLIGWTSITVKPNMVGSRIAVFTAVEGKAGKNKATAAQRRFIEGVERAGGISGIAREPDDIKALIEAWHDRHQKG